MHDIKIINVNVVKSLSCNDDYDEEDINSHTIEILIDSNLRSACVCACCIQGSSSRSWKVKNSFERVAVTKQNASSSFSFSPVARCFLSHVLRVFTFVRSLQLLLVVLFFFSGGAFRCLRFIPFILA